MREGSKEITGEEIRLQHLKGSPKTYFSIGIIHLCFGRAVNSNRAVWISDFQSVSGSQFVTLAKLVPHLVPPMIAVVISQDLLLPGCETCTRSGTKIRRKGMFQCSVEA